MGTKKQDTSRKKPINNKDDVNKCNEEVYNGSCEIPSITSWFAQLREASNKKRKSNPEQFRAWRERVSRFYRKSVWEREKNGVVVDLKTCSLRAVPSKVQSSSFKTPKRPMRREVGDMSVVKEPELPSQVLLHYFYMDAKSRAQERIVATKRLEELRERRIQEREKREHLHSIRMAKFAKRGLQRRVDALDSGKRSPVRCIRA